MRFLIGIIALSLVLQSCSGNKSNQETQVKVAFDQALADSLERMSKVDQIAAFIPQGEYQNWSKERWNAFKDSVFTTHQQILKQLFEQYGFLGIDRVGEKGSMNFWLMVQHSDHDPEFQKEILDQMKIEVEKGNASPSNYGLLVDRVNLNTGKPQIYGTQVTYNMETGQAYPRNLADSASVNGRRKAIGMEPLEVYLNTMSLMHYEMNKAIYLEKGIMEAKLYPVEEQ